MAPSTCAASISPKMSGKITFRKKRNTSKHSLIETTKSAISLTSSASSSSACLAQKLGRRILTRSASSNRNMMKAVFDSTSAGIEMRNAVFVTTPHNQTCVSAANAGTLSGKIQGRQNMFWNQVTGDTAQQQSFDQLSNDSDHTPRKPRRVSSVEKQVGTILDSKKRRSSPRLQKLLAAKRLHHATNQRAQVNSSFPEKPNAEWVAGSPGVNLCKQPVTHRGAGAMRAPPRRSLRRNEASVSALANFANIQLLSSQDLSAYAKASPVRRAPTRWLASANKKAVNDRPRRVSHYEQESSKIATLATNNSTLRIPAPMQRLAGIPPANAMIPLAGCSKSARFCGSEETWDCIRKDFYLPTSCMACYTELCCIQNVAHVLCPTCKCLTRISTGPTTSAAALAASARSMAVDCDVDRSDCVGVGFTLEDLRSWEDKAQR